MRFTLRLKIIALAITAVALPVIVLTTTLFIGAKSTEEAVNVELEKLMEESTRQISLDAWHMIEAQDQTVQLKVDSDLNVARRLLRDAGGIGLAKETTPWQAVNQYTKEVTPVALPRMLLGDQWLGQISEAGTPAPLVDEVQGLVGGTTTVFQRMPDDSFLRVATNVIKSDGARAIGTYIPKRNPDGGANPVVSALLKGKTFRGQAYVVNAWYVTAYEPILDASGQVVGALYVGVKRENIDALRNAIMDITVGKTGYVFVLGGQGDEKGHYIISKGGAADGKDILEAKDADGVEFIKEMVEGAVELGEGEVFYQRYPWKNAGEDEARQKIAAISYYKDWDWVIGASTYVDDYTATRKNVSDAINGLAMLSALIGLFILLGAAAVSWFVGNGVVKPLRNTVDALEDMAAGEGDLTVRLPELAQDEVGDLARAFNAFVEKIQITIAEVAATAITVASAATELSATSDELADSSQEMRQQTEMVSAAVEEIQATLATSATGADMVSSSVDTVARTSREMSNEIATIADHAGEVSSTVNNVATAIEEMSASLSEVTRLTLDSATLSGQSNERAQEARTQMSRLASTAHNIGKVIELIEDIADQTNLLALNATIEAASAGEAGRGFAVVAKEVKDLARQTSKATEEIAKEVEAIQRDAASTEGHIQGVSELIEEVSRLASEIAAAAEEQTATTNEIAHSVAVGATAAEGISKESDDVSRDVSEVAKSSDAAAASVQELARSTNEISTTFGEVSRTIATVAEATTESSSHAMAAKNASAELAKQSEGRRALVEEFKF